MMHEISSARLLVNDVFSQSANCESSVPAAPQDRSRPSKGWATDCRKDKEMKEETKTSIKRLMSLLAESVSWIEKSLYFAGEVVNLASSANNFRVEKQPGSPYCTDICFLGYVVLRVGVRRPAGRIVYSRGEREGFRITTYAFFLLTAAKKTGGFSGANRGIQRKEIGYGQQ
jgi:hypothetical protein